MRYLILLALLTACSATGPVYNGDIHPSAGEADIIIYRPDMYYASARSFPASINDAESCDLHNAGFFVAHAEGGVNISSSAWDIPGMTRLALKAQPGHSYYIKLIPGTGTLIDQVNTGPVFFNLMDSEQAKQEMKGLKQECL